jgi:hypothetical protein
MSARYILRNPKRIQLVELSTIYSKYHLFQPAPPLLCAQLEPCPSIPSRLSKPCLVWAMNPQSPTPNGIFSYWPSGCLATETDKIVEGGYHFAFCALVLWIRCRCHLLLLWICQVCATGRLPEFDEVVPEVDRRTGAYVGKLCVGYANSVVKYRNIN